MTAAEEHLNDLIRHQESALAAQRRKADELPDEEVMHGWEKRRRMGTRES